MQWVQMCMRTCCRWTFNRQELHRKYQWFGDWQLADSNRISFVSAQSILKDVLYLKSVKYHYVEKAPHWCVWNFAVWLSEAVEISHSWGTYKSWKKNDKVDWKWESCQQFLFSIKGIIQLLYVIWRKHSSEATIYRRTTSGSGITYTARFFLPTTLLIVHKPTY